MTELTLRSRFTPGLGVGKMRISRALQADPLARTTVLVRSQVVLLTAVRGNRMGAAERLAVR